MGTNVSLRRPLASTIPAEIEMVGESRAVGQFRVAAPLDFTKEVFVQTYGTARWNRMKTMFPKPAECASRAFLAAACPEALYHQIAAATKARMLVARQGRQVAVRTGVERDLALLKFAEADRRLADRADLVWRALESATFPGAPSIDLERAAKDRDAAIAAAGASRDKECDKITAKYHAAGEKYESGHDRETYLAAYDTYLREIDKADKAYDHACDAANQAVDDAYDDADERERDLKAIHLRLTAAFVGDWSHPEPLGLKQLHYLLTGETLK
jgi:hypothetical protein